MDDRKQKILNLISGLVRSASDLEVIRQALDGAGYSLMRQVEKTPFPTVTDPVRLANARHGIILDTETTGLDHKKHKVIQLSMLRFTYDDEGILSIGEMFDRFNDPGEPIPELVTALTGITDDMVKDHHITSGDIRDFAAGVSIIVAHNAAFDRKMCEKNFSGSGFAAVEWHCSIEQVDWIARGRSGKSLEVVAMKNGLIYGSHNASNDILATAFILAESAPGEETPFAEMLRRGREGAVSIIAKGAPFEAKDLLKENGYYWSDDGSEAGGHAKVWHKTMNGTAENLDAEAEFLRSQVYKRDMLLPMFILQPNERYSARRPSRPETFTTSDVRSIKDLMSHDTGYREVTQPSLF